jgi:hypothetical protein
MIPPSIKKIGPAILSTFLLGLTLGIYLWNIFHRYENSVYQIKADTNWIVYPDFKVAQSYFRKKFYLDHKDDIRNAWLRVSAPEGFKVYINNKSIGSSSTNEEIATEFYNITPFLKDGTNLISIHNNISVSDRSTISVEGYYENWQGVTWKITTDETWKVSFFEPNLLDSELDWYDLKMKDDDWKHAASLKQPLPWEKSKLIYPPSLFTSSLTSQFVWDGLRENRMFLRYPVYIHDKSEIKDIWIRTYIEHGYSYNFLINGTLVDTIESTVGVPEAKETQEKINMYSITHYLHQGKNIIGIFVYSERSNPRFYIDGITVSKNGNENALGISSEAKCSNRFFKGWYKKTFNDSGWRQPVSVGAITSDEVSTKREISATNPPENYVLLFFVKKYSLIIAVAILTALISLCFSYALSRFKGLSMQNPFSTIGLINFVVFLFLLFIYMLSFDERFSPQYPFQLKFVILALLIFLISVFSIAFLLKKDEQEGLVMPIEKGNTRKDWIFIFLLFILGLALRLYIIDFRPLNDDEITAFFYSKGVLTKLYPYLALSPHLPEKIITTSELVPYFMAIGLKLFGFNEFGVRFTSVLFGSLTIILIYISGKDIFDRRVGILSSLIYAFLPFTINIAASYARYPSQLQFFSLLTGYLFYKAISGENLSPKYLYGSAISFMATYLSWEGSAFLLPSFFISLILYKRRDFSWIKNKHLWVSVIFVSLFIFYQLSTRYIYINSIQMQIGTGVSGISLIPQWTQPLFNPYSYIENFFLLSNLVPVTFFFVVGLLFFFRDRVMSFWYGLIIFIIFAMTSFVEVHASRYVYHILPFFLLTGISAFFRCLDFLLSHESRLSKILRKPVTAIACIMIFLPTNNLLMKPYNLPFVETRGDFTRVSFYNLNNYKAIAYLKEHIRPGDKIISSWPHSVTFNIGRCEYFTENKLRLSVLVLKDEPLAGNRISGSPLIYDLNDLQDILGRHERIWFVNKDFEAKRFDQDYVDYIKKKMRPVYEDYGTIVYLWDR